MLTYDLSVVAYTAKANNLTAHFRGGRNAVNLIYHLTRIIRTVKNDDQDDIYKFSIVGFSMRFSTTQKFVQLRG